MVVTQQSALLSLLGQNNEQETVVVYRKYAKHVSHVCYNTDHF